MSRITVSRTRCGLALLMPCLLLLYLTLASCGGGGGGSSVTTTPGDDSGATAGDGNATTPGPQTPSPPVTGTGLPSITLARVATGFTSPVHITHAGDGSGRLFITEKRGVVKIIKDGVVLPAPFLDLSGTVLSDGAEQGLLSIAFPPGYATKRHLYVDYTSRSGIGDTVVARIPTGTDPDTADASAATTILSVAQPFANHNGGQLAFGPDGYLYVGMGDGGGESDPQDNAQDRSRLLGKILRLDVESAVPPYAIPAGNPFGNEVWSYGLRNPWRFSFDRSNGDLFIADVGQNRFEEVNVQQAGRGGDNYGWDIMEGAHCYASDTCDQTGLTLPVVEYSHDEGNCSITGGLVYRGARYPALQGVYLYGDFCSGRIWGMRRNGTQWENKLLLESQLMISSFGEDEAGNVYLTDFRSGEVFRIEVP